MERLFIKTGDKPEESWIKFRDEFHKMCFHSKVIIRTRTSRLILTENETGPIVEHPFTANKYILNIERVERN